MSQKLNWGTLPNTRDLGGMQTADGHRVRPGKLIRSGHLFDADDEGQKQVIRAVCLVIDLRTSAERAQKPNPSLTGVQEVHLPIVRDLAAGITRERESDQEAIRQLMQREEDAVAYMEQMYRQFMCEFAVAQYGRMVHLLLEKREGAVLWHCTAGKDRAGFGAALIELLLGIPRETVLEDYLRTDLYLAEQFEALRTMYAGRASALAMNRGAVQALFGTRPSYLEAVFSEMDTRYGSFEGFARQGLKLSCEEAERLKQMYLE